MVRLDVVFGSGCYSLYAELFGTVLLMCGYCYAVRCSFFVLGSVCCFACVFVCGSLCDVAFLLFVLDSLCFRCFFGYL